MSNLDVKVVLLAAGYSSRMKRCKFQMPFSQRESILEHILRVFEEANFRNIVIVTQEKFVIWIENLLTQFPSCSVKIVVNENPELERFHSLKLGLIHSDPSLFYFIHNCDMPFFEKENLDALFEKRGIADVVVPSLKSKGTHPILFNSKVAEILSALDSHSNLRTELTRFTKKHVEIDNEKSLFDINTLEDYRRLISYKYLNTESFANTDKSNSMASSILLSR